MKESDLDSLLVKLIREHLQLIVLGFLLLSSAVIRYHLMKHGTSQDFFSYLVPWVDTYKQSIPQAFKEGVGDYYIPYNILLALASLVDVPTNYSVGTISCIFDYLTCFTIYKILTENFSDRISRDVAAVCSVLFLYIPAIAFDGAAWKQCDSIYSFFLMVLLKCVLDGKIRTAFVMLGIAFSFKQQSLFILPLLIILYFMNRKIKIVYFGYSILVYLIAGIPAIIMGRPAMEVYSIYLGQIEMYHKMTFNYPNLYQIAITDYEKAHLYAFLFTVFMFAMAFWYLLRHFDTLSNRYIMYLASWCVWTACMFLPAMHQRYDYMVVNLFVICLALAGKANRRLAIISMVFHCLSNVISYCYTLFGNDYSPAFAFSVNAIGYSLFSYLLWNYITREEMERNTKG